MLRENPQPIHLEDYRPPNYLIDSVDLSFELADAQTRVHSRLELRRNTAPKAENGPLHLHGESLDLQSILLDGRELDADEYCLDEAGLTLPDAPERCVLETQVLIHPDANTALEGLYRSGPMLCTQCEPEGFRRITFFIDRPDVMARFRTTLIGDKSRYPVLLANGNPADHEGLADGRHTATWDDPFPKPSYLFALVAGDLQRVEDNYTTSSGRHVELAIYVEPQNLDRCAHAMLALKNAMAWDEREYGREYDLDVYNIVAVNDFNMGAMENKGLNIFNSKYVLARPDTATDSDFQGVEGVIAHEYFHNWTGNRITCRDWFQLSLKEGFTVFRDQEFSADMGSRGVKRIEDVRLLRAHQFAEDSGPMAHPVRPASYIEINNFYTVTVYEKGAEVVRMQRNLLGREGFRRATDLYFERHDGQAVTTDDFVQCMADAADSDLEQFKLWYSQAGTPELDVSSHFDGEAGVYQLTVRQSCPPTPDQPHKSSMHIPFALALLDARGHELPLVQEGEDGREPGTRVLDLRAPERVFRFTGMEAEPVPSLLRGLSAPVKLNYSYSVSQLMFLMAHDSDGFNRWDAAQTLSQRVILGMLAEPVADPVAQVPAGYIEVFRRSFASRMDDAALWTEVLSLPTESYLGDQMEQVDVDGIHAVREAVRERIGRDLHAELIDLVQRSTVPGPYLPEPKDIGRRALKNLALGYLMAAGSREAVELCLAQYQGRHNMTDVMAALSLLVNSEAPEREQVLAEFEQRWRDDSLVLDKWFAVQAQSPRADTLTQVERLMQHPAFSIKNPNKVRALIGAFAAGNPVRFHARSGSGYRFLIDRVLELDPINPQVASRMLRQMSRWRRYDPARQTLMKEQLQRVLNTPEVSKDVYEIATRSLEKA